MSADNIWTLVSAVIGALVGSLTAVFPAYLIANRTSEETLRRDQMARSEQQRASTLQAFVKLQLITNGAESIFRGIEDMIAEADSSGHQALATWQKVRPLIGVAEKHVRFEADELTLFVARDSEFTNDLLLAAERYATLELSLKEYGKLRHEVTSQLPVQQMVGPVGTTFLTQQQAEIFVHQSYALESLIVQLRENARKDYKQILSLAERFGQKARNYLDDPKFPILVFDESKGERP